MFKKNEDGAALVLVLILLLVGTVLVTALATTARNHINIAVHEEGMSKAFHNAESGVEYVRANIDDIVSDGIEEIDSDDLDLESENIEFKITIKGSGDDYEGISEGIYELNSNRDFTQKITFDIISELGSDFTKPFNIESDLDPETNINDIITLNGSSIDTLYPSALFIKDDITPTWDDWSNLRNNAGSWNGNSGIDGEILNFTGNNINNNTKIEKSIVFIDGDISINPNKKWENSIIVINGNLTFNGTPTSFIDNSIFFVYGNENSNNSSLTTNGKIKETSWNLELNFDELPSEFKVEKDKIIKNKPPEITNWSQL